MTPELIKMIALTYEACSGREPSDAIKRLICDDLERYPENAVATALERCRREIRGGLCLADVIQRIDDGRPGPQKAWAMVQGILGNEDATVIWTTEISKAFFVVCSMTDNISARVSFLEAYEKELTLARSENRPVEWKVSLGYDPNQRQRALMEAVQNKRLTPERARELVPELPPMQGEDPQLLSRNEIAQDEIKRLCQKVIKSV